MCPGKWGDTRGAMRSRWRLARRRANGQTDLALFLILPTAALGHWMNPWVFLNSRFGIYKMGRVGPV